MSDMEAESSQNAPLDLGVKEVTMLALKKEEPEQEPDQEQEQKEMVTLYGVDGAVEQSISYNMDLVKLLEEDREEEVMSPFPSSNTPAPSTPFPPSPTLEEAVHREEHTPTFPHFSHKMRTDTGMVGTPPYSRALLPPLGSLLPTMSLGPPAPTWPSTSMTYPLPMMPQLPVTLPRTNEHNGHNPASGSSPFQTPYTCPSTSHHSPPPTYHPSSQAPSYHLPQVSSTPLNPTSLASTSPYSPVSTHHYSNYPYFSTTPQTSISPHSSTPTPLSSPSSSALSGPTSPTRGLYYDGSQLGEPNAKTVAPFADPGIQAWVLQRQQAYLGHHLRLYHARIADLPSL